MKFFTPYLLLFAFGCYSIFSGQLSAIQNVSDGEQIECALETLDLGCCQANVEGSSEEVNTDQEKDTSGKPCCKDQCCCVKLVKSPFIGVENKLIQFSSLAIEYRETFTFSYQQYTFNIFTPPQSLV
jgi:hypothetical protein